MRSIGRTGRAGGGRAAVMWNRERAGRKTPNRVRWGGGRGLVPDGWQRRAPGRAARGCGGWSRHLGDRAGRGSILFFWGRDRAGAGAGPQADGWPPGNPQYSGQTLISEVGPVDCSTPCFLTARYFFGGRIQKFFTLLNRFKNGFVSIFGLHGN